MSTQVILWSVFAVVVLGLLALDLGVFHRKSRAVKIREALIWCAVWVSLALIFNVFVYITRGPTAGLEFLAGYLIEEALSIDNLFVFLLIFSYFRVPAEFQHKVLFWGIAGALVMRAAFILAGIALIQKFHWIIYVFGAFLILTGVRMITEQGKEIHPEKNPVLRLFRRLMPVTDAYEGDRFFVMRGARRFATPLFVVLLMVETTDLIFAVDSIPAILAITRDPFIVYTSNVFAILGLRSIYFALAGLMQIFHYLNYGLCFILVFVGVKMLLSDFYKIPVGIALGAILAILLASILASLLKPRTPAAASPPSEAHD
ncbi:MAG: TerC family protein [Acidobacteria bacterium]|nr:TerC family protein [Acidobacteriota bacterium]MCW5969677.1 TerC family protein [Blastocatellales bacterium]